LAQAGNPLPVYVGMRHWHPYLADTLRKMADAGIRRTVGVVLAPQRCDSSWQQYQRDMADARQKVDPGAPEVEYLDGWHDHPGFIEAAADHVREALDRLPPDQRHDARIIFTAHSIPLAMEGADQYVRQVRQGAEGVTAKLGRSRWSIAYQSRSGNPRDPWLEPDVCDLLTELGQAGETAAVLMPIGFVCDHVEVLYDLDIEARQAAERAGITMTRAETAGTHPAYIRMLVELITARCVRNQKATAK
jgi:ferrochelatase